MLEIKRFSLGGGSKSGRHVKLVAKNAVISESGAVTVDVADALARTDVKDQLQAVKRIREASARVAVAS